MSEPVCIEPNCRACAVAAACGFNPTPQRDVNRRCTLPKAHKGPHRVSCVHCAGTGMIGGSPGCANCKGTGAISWSAR